MLTFLRRHCNDCCVERILYSGKSDDVILFAEEKMEKIYSSEVGKISPVEFQNKIFGAILHALKT